MTDTTRSGEYDSADHIVGGDLCKGSAESQYLPQDLAAEKSVIGAMLLSADTIADLVELIHPHDFAQVVHRTIYEVILDLYVRHQPIDITTVAHELGNKEQLDRVGGRAYLKTLVSIRPTAESISRCAEIIAGKAVLRRLVEAGSQIVDLGLEADGKDNLDVNHVVGCARSILADAVESQSKEPLPELSDCLMSAMDDLDGIASGARTSANIPTGFADLDEITNGLSRGSLTVIGAQPGVGSSTLAMDFVRAAAIRHDIPAAYLSLDNTTKAITQRLLSAETRTRLTDIQSARMTEEEWTRLAKRMTQIHLKSLVISRIHDWDITSLTDLVVELAAEKSIRLVIVDPLHLVTNRRAMPYENREREVAEVTRRLKRLALDTDTAIVATAQLSTNPGPRQPVPARPSLADLRDSGTIAHVADRVILLQRPDAWERDDPRAGEVDLILAKNRTGPTPTMTVAHQLHYSRFVDLARE